MEWDEIQFPTRRTKGTYWEDNWQTIQNQVQLWNQSIEIVPGIELYHTGGHSKGHAILKLIQKNDVAVHLADIFPTHAHQNPLWVSAFDDYPMESIQAKEKWIEQGIEKGYQFLFYHDAYYRMVKWDETGEEIIDSLKRSKLAAIPLENK